MDDLLFELRGAQTRYIRAHSAVVNAWIPSEEQWAELDAAGDEYRKLADELAERERKVKQEAR